MRSQILFLSMSLFIGVGAIAPANAEDSDPLESINRATFAFNDTIDKYFLKPVAKGYRAVTPDLVEDGVSNFFDNLGEPLNIVNGLLQGKVAEAGSDTLRLLVNSTVGILGFIDIGSRIGLDKHDEDFGQTLGAWGVGSGPYIVLAFLGPSTLRDAAMLVPDAQLSPTQHIDHDLTKYEFAAASVIDTRAGLLDHEKLLAGDRYAFIRDTYLQNREFRVKDGNTNDEFLDDEDEDDILFDEEE